MGGKKRQAAFPLPTREELGEAGTLEPSDVLDAAATDAVFEPDGSGGVNVSYRENELAGDLRGVAQHIDRLHEKQPAVTGARGGKAKGKMKQQYREEIEKLMTPLINLGKSNACIVTEVWKRLRERGANDMAVRELAPSTIEKYYLRPLRRRLKAEKAPGRG